MVTCRPLSSPPPWIYISLLIVFLAWPIGLICMPLSSTDQRLFNSEAVVPLDGCIGQSFYSERDGLARIDVSLVARGHAVGTVTVRVREGDPVGPEVRVVVRRLTAPDVESPIQRRDPYEVFSFLPLPESGGKTYTFCVEISDLEGEPFLIRFHEADVYADGARYEGGQAVRGDLTFRVYHAQGLVQRFQELGKRLARDKPGVLGRPITYVLFLGLYLIAMLALPTCIPHPWNLYPCSPKTRL
ncbi:MAG TPA: hypothetical protein ENI39_01170 [Anaerolineae bacterium]|nr:hypothetical protein [Anaerolineae bacterium]